MNMNQKDINQKDINKNVKKYEHNNRNNSCFKKADQAYGYYSRVLKEPFDSVEELREAEEAYFAKLKAKEDKSAQKKADAAVVEEAFTALNAARKAYKQELTSLTAEYRASLEDLKCRFLKQKSAVQHSLEDAEKAYSAALKAFTEKYPEGFHLTLKDGDFETTIDSTTSGTNCGATKFQDLFDLLFKI